MYTGNTHHVKFNVISIGLPMILIIIFVSAVIFREILFGLLFLQANTPYISLIRNTTLSSVPIGYPSVYTALIKIAPQESAKVAVYVSLGSSELSICGIRIKDVGDNLPCVDKNVTTSFSGTSGLIDIGIVTNTGKKD